jgi:hypothetical protein
MIGLEEEKKKETRARRKFSSFGLTSAPSLYKQLEIVA